MDLRLSLPVQEAERRLPFLEELELGLEVYLDPEHLEDDALFANLSRALPRPPSVHLPFWNLDLLSPDPGVRGLSLRRLLFGLERASELGADRAVFHSGMPYGLTPEEAQERAFRLAEALGPVVQRAQALGIRLLLENTFEPNPDVLRPVLEVHGEAVGFCFDAAHAWVFSATPDPKPWLALKPEHLHLNDTDGPHDRHWNLEAGVLEHRNWLPPYLDRTLVLEVRGNPLPSVTFLLGLEEASLPPMTMP